MVDPCGAKSWAAAGSDSRRDGRERADRRVKHTAARAQSRVGRARQFAGRAAGPGDLAKPAGECQRRGGAKDQFLGQRRPRTANLCNAESHRTTARQRDAGATGRRRQGRQSQRASAAVARRAASRASCAVCGLRGQCGEHDRDPGTGARTENHGWKRGEFRSPLA